MTNVMGQIPGGPDAAVMQRHQGGPLREGQLGIREQRFHLGKKAVGAHAHQVTDRIAHAVIGRRVIRLHGKTLSAAGILVAGTILA